MSLATVEKEIEAIYSRWQTAAVTSVTEATLRHLARYRDLYARTLALAARAEASSPRVALAALVQAAKLNEAEARLLGASDRHLNRGWLEQATAEQAAAEARAERERERVAHNERRELWEEQVDDELLERVKGVLASDEREALKRLTKAVKTVQRDEYEDKIEVPEDDPWEPEWSEEEEGVYPEEIEDPRTRWSALARVELADYPQALALVLETIASYEPPEHPGPYRPAEEEDISPAVDPGGPLGLLELLRGRSAPN